MQRRFGFLGGGEQKRVGLATFDVVLVTEIGAVFLEVDDDLGARFGCGVLSQFVGARSEQVNGRDLEKKASTTLLNFSLPILNRKQFTLNSQRADIVLLNAIPLTVLSNTNQIKFSTFFRFI